jgi:hypothetical protein
MNVKEVIERLSKMDPDATVYIFNRDGEAVSVRFEDDIAVFGDVRHCGRSTPQEVRDGVLIGSDSF